MWACVSRCLGLKERGDAVTTRCCGRAVTGNSKSLIIMLVLFTTIAGAQYVAAVVANSLSLQADCISMLVDALSYVGNLLAECTKNSATKARLELGMSFLSIALLVVFNTYYFFDAIWHASDKGLGMVVVNQTTGADEINGGETTFVNGGIVLVFALLGLLFDAVSLVSFKLFSGKEAALDSGMSGSDSSASSAASSASSAASSSSAAAAASASGKASASTLSSNPGRVNMLSALGHVTSDLLRSTTTLVESIILLSSPELNSVEVDGWCTIFICLVISIGNVAMVRKWLKAFGKYRRGHGARLGRVGGRMGGAGGMDLGCGGCGAEGGEGMLDEKLVIDMADFGPVSPDAAASPASAEEEPRSGDALVSSATHGGESSDV